jgi:GlcNAc-P-P-Und epimerase
VTRKAVAVVTGGSGYIGGHLIRSFLAGRRFDAIVNFDLRERDFDDPRVTKRRVDVREPLREELPDFDPGASWIFHLAALCREPGSERREYFDTNVGGSERVLAFAEAMGFRNIYFTSSMSSYGRMEAPTPESAPQYPETPYGISKAIAERVHRVWLERGADRRLVVCRPGVIFGPGDVENVPRMIRAVHRGYFVFPGSPDIVKGYGYIHGLIESVEFVLQKPDRYIVYNYAERDCVSLREMVRTIQQFLGKRAVTIRVPIGLLIAEAALAQGASGMLGRKSAIHPVRVRKAAFPTNLKPQYLIDQGFAFRYPLETALAHWRSEAPCELA